MIGPSSGSSSVGGDTTADEHHHHHHHHLPAKRRVLEELDIESICDEVCGHHHHQSAKRPRFLTDLQGALILDGHDAVNLQDNLIYAPFDEQQHHHHHHHYHHQEDGSGDGPVTRLEVLVVDGTWDDALESFEAAAAAAVSTQSCDTALTELSLVHDQHAVQQQQQQQQQQQLHSHDLQNLQDINYQSYWSSEQVQHQPGDYQEQPPQEQQQQQPQQQQQTTTTMPKVQQQSSADANRTRNGFGAPAPSLLPASSYEDQENGNLSWLLDFKLDSFIEAPEDKSTGLAPRDFQGNKSKYNGSGRTANAYTHESTKRTCNYEASASGGAAARYDGAYSPTSYGALAENRNRCTGPKKPPFTYTELIEHALQERGELTVSAIYQWISEHFPYYKSNDDRWKNSVRHNLSINPHFRKGSKAPHGAGHLWAIASQDESKPRQLFNIASIRQALKDEEAKAQKANTRVMTVDDEIAAATASIAQPVDEESICETITLEHCAEQILSGIKKEVEVQYLVPMMLSSNGEVIHSQQCHSQNTQLCSVEETDFLNPVPNKVAAEECGLEECGYLVTDLNPSSLGLNMSESEVVTTDNLFGEELSFQFYEFASSSQLQSA